MFSKIVVLLWISYVIHSQDPSPNQLLEAFPSPPVTSTATQNPRIINGHLATREQFPYNVMLMLLSPKNKYYGCGGSFIKNNWILTAAHCLVNVSTGFMYAGTIDLINGPTAYKANIKNSQMFLHPHFVNVKLGNDIALVKLAMEVPKSEFIEVVDMVCDSCDLVGIDGIVMGFGAVNASDGRVSVNMKFVNMEVIGNSECQRFWTDKITNGMLCTSSSFGGTTCFGDSGSGLIVNSLGRDILVGVVSFGNDKCAVGSKHPQVFTRVSHFMDWITNTIANN